MSLDAWIAVFTAVAGSDNEDWESLARDEAALLRDVAEVLADPVIDDATKVEAAIRVFNLRAAKAIA